MEIHPRMSHRNDALETSRPASLWRALNLPALVKVLLSQCGRLADCIPLLHFTCSVVYIQICIIYYCMIYIYMYIHTHIQIILQKSIYVYYIYVCVIYIYTYTHYITSTTAVTIESSHVVTAPPWTSRGWGEARTRSAIGTWCCLGHEKLRHNGDKMVI